MMVKYLNLALCKSLCWNKIHLSLLIFSVFDYIAQGVKENADLIKRYHVIIHDVIGEDPSEKNLK